MYVYVYIDMQMQFFGLTAPNDGKVYSPESLHPTPVKHKPGKPIFSQLVFFALTIEVPRDMDRI